ncbi:MAG: glycine cleavage system aminomethyltransferase GcvT [Nevskiaceae bacterium]|nr:MAG: glycine cleavage system aminomethyltransferase GcvT [Nevskiaceae bacterium]TBR73942.1 MAG: glycine cleavage system aminomethyltransferase GcvT [Nevskiaceae bacterium]
MLKKTALHDAHAALGAKLVDFAGWEMPVQYRSALDEHHAVRTACGMFDVSHMQAVDFSGARTADFLRHLLANDVAKLSAPGGARYTCLLNPEGGVIDDLIVTRRDGDAFRSVVNAGTADKDIAWFQTHAAAYGVTVKQRTDLGILAVQGPQARTLVVPHLPAALRERAFALKPFTAAWEGEWYVSRTGYTGEDGFELVLPHADIVALWNALLADGAMPCGLGARDSLRLEAGMNLYGNDMDETVSPLECGLGWTVAWVPEDRAFIGRAALEKQRASPPRRMVAVMLDGRGVLRAHMPVRDAAQRDVGQLSSGGFAPTLKQSIGFARVDAQASAPFEVEIRGRWLPLKQVKAPFVRNGKALV